MDMTTHFIPPLAAKSEALARLLPLVQNLAASRRGLILAPLLAALPAGLWAGSAQAIDPNETQVTLPDQFQWKAGLPGAPALSVETVPVFGATDKPGPYDRLCFVLSGTWWVNSGASFEPDATVPVPAGGFVRRVAHTPHYDGVKKGQAAPAVIGIFGEAPTDFKLVDPSKPPVRDV
jgi:hypothetical protein